MHNDSTSVTGRSSSSSVVPLLAGVAAESCSLSVPSATSRMAGNSGAAFVSAMMEGSLAPEDLALVGISSGESSRSQVESRKDRCQSVLWRRWQNDEEQKLIEHFRRT